MNLRDFLFETYEAPAIEISPGNMCLLKGELGPLCILGHLEGKLRTMEKGTTVYMDDRDWYIVYNRKEEFLLDGSRPFLKSLHVFESSLKLLTDKDYVRVKKEGQTWYFTLGEGYIKDKAENPFRYINPVRPLPNYDNHLYYDKIDGVTGDIDVVYDMAWEAVDQREDLDVTPAYFDTVFEHKLPETVFYYKSEKDSRKLFNLVIRDILDDWREDHKSFKAFAFDAMYYRLADAAGISSWYRPRFSTGEIAERWRIYNGIRGVFSRLEEKGLTPEQYGAWFRNEYGGRKEFHMSKMRKRDTVEAFINNRDYDEDNYRKV